MLNDEWRQRATCRTMDPEMFFPHDSSHSTQEYAKSICRRCPVRTECLAEALQRKEEHGIWGGLNPHQRENLHRKVYGKTLSELATWLEETA